MTVEVSKLNAYAVLSLGDGVEISKMNAYVILSPGSDVGAPTIKRSRGYTQILRRPPS